LIVALARFGGLRTPSETMALRWSDINWEKNRVRVPSPKTEHHSGGGSRIIPLFPDLRPYLEEAWDEAEPGTEYVITRYRGDSRLNLRSRLLDIIRLAGLKEWPKLFQNLRSTRETELAERFPMHVVCAWIGNSEPVAAKHYLQLTDEHFERAVSGESAGDEVAQNAAQYTQVEGRKGRDKNAETPAFTEKYGGLPTCTDVQAPPVGLEPTT